MTDLSSIHSFSGNIFKYHRRFTSCKHVNYPFPQFHLIPHWNRIGITMHWVAPVCKHHVELERDVGFQLGQYFSFYWYIWFFFSHASHRIKFCFKCESKWETSWEFRLSDDYQYSCASMFSLELTGRAVARNSGPCALRRGGLWELRL